jgi:tetratricopeptide (TPR) repeat protein
MSPKNDPAAARRAPVPSPNPPLALTAVSLTVLVLATLAAFWPALGNGFVNWDDGANLVDNFNYRGLGWDQLSWMWTTFHMGHYQPLNWMTLGLDYLVWGMDPFGYHLTSLLLHAANAVLFYFVARIALRRASSPGDGVQAGLAALLAALLFAAHPLRVESVAWATERRDVLSGFFCLATLLFYLKACAPARARADVRLLRAALACFVLSLLSKAAAMTLPLALLVLDVCPLGRLPADPARWREPEASAVLREKLPFAAAALPFAVVAFLAQRHTGVIARFSSVGLVERLELAAYGASFYLLKTVAPLRLLPLYARPVRFDAWDPRLVAAAAAAAGVSAAAWLARRRRPELAAAWSWYLILLAPVSGLVLSGIYTAADRYSYLPCLAWALLAAAALQAAARRFATPVLAGALVLACAGLIPLTRRQCAVWRDSETLWRYTLSIDPDSAPAHNNLGTALGRAGRQDEAAAEFSRALALDPDYAEAHNNLATALVRRGRLDEAVAEYREALRAQPAYAMARDNLGAALTGQGKLAEAIAVYREALELEPGDAHAHNNLGLALSAAGRGEEAAAEYRQALKLSPHYAEAARNLSAATGASR